MIIISKVQYFNLVLITIHEKKNIYYTRAYKTTYAMGKIIYQITYDFRFPKILLNLVFQI